MITDPLAANNLRDLRRGQIVAVARRIVATQGLAALTIAHLESQLSFSRGVITHHFRNKDEIVNAVLQSALDEIDEATQARAAASEGFSAKVEAVVGAVVRGFLDHREASSILVSFWGRIGSDPVAASLNASLYARYRRQAARLISEGQDGGYCRLDVNPDTVAVLLVGHVIGIVTQAFFEKGAVDVEAAIAEAVEMANARLIRQD